MGGEQQPTQCPASSKEAAGPGRIFSRVSNVFHAFYCSSTMQIKSAGAGPTISHRISHSRLATAPKASVSSLEILPRVILGCDLIEEAHRGLHDDNRSSCDWLPSSSECQAWVCQALLTNRTQQLTPSLHTTTKPCLKSHSPYLIGGVGLLVLLQEGLQVLTCIGCRMKYIFKQEDTRIRVR